MAPKFHGNREKSLESKNLEDGELLGKLKAPENLINLGNIENLGIVEKIENQLEDLENVENLENLENLEKLEGVTMLENCVTLNFPRNLENL